MNVSGYFGGAFALVGVDKLCRVRIEHDVEPLRDEETLAGMDQVRVANLIPFRDDHVLARVAVMARFAMPESVSPDLTV